MVGGGVWGVVSPIDRLEAYPTGVDRLAAYPTFGQAGKACRTGGSLSHGGWRRIRAAAWAGGDRELWHGRGELASAIECERSPCLFKHIAGLNFPTVVQFLV